MHLAQNQPMLGILTRFVYKPVGCRDNIYLRRSCMIKTDFWVYLDDDDDDMMMTTTTMTVKDIDFS
jgi:hypothetical protein